MSPTAIQWTDETWNPVRGCTKISPGCKHCYAATFAERFRGVKGHPYEQGFDPRLVPEKLEAPLHWKKPRMVFVNSMSDLFQDDVPDEYIAAAWTTMRAARQHTYQVLTKRAGRAASVLRRLHWVNDRACIAAAKYDGDRRFQADPLPNVWVGVSVENQQYAAERIPHLLATPAAVRFLSCEPLLGPVDLLRWLPVVREVPTIGWVIVGGESGVGARPFDLAWARSIIEQCRNAGVPIFVKQLGARPMDEVDGPKGPGPMYLRLKDRTHGGDPKEWPEPLRVREFPR